MSTDNPKRGSAEGVDRHPGADELEQVRRELAGVCGRLEESERLRREAEASMATADGRLAAVIDRIDDGIVIDRAIRDQDGRIVDFVVDYANGAACRFIGRRPDEILGHRTLDLFPGWRENLQLDACVRVVETGEPLVHVLVRGHDLTVPSDSEGYDRDYEISMTKFGDGYVAVLHDVVARKRAEEELARSQLLKLAEDARLEMEQRYRLIIDTITDYVVSIKFENGRPVEVTHGAGCVAVTGYTADEFSRDPDLWETTVMAGNLAAARQQIGSLIAGGSPGPAEFPIVRRDGAVRWVRMTPVVRRDARGIPISVDSVMQDITERRELQEQLLQSQKMEGIGRLAGGVAHDFNNLLTAILGYVEMCKVDLPPELPSDHPARLDLQEVATAGERAATLTRQLLAFASRQIVAPVRLDLGVLVADSLKMLKLLLGDDIEIETALEAGASIVEADAGQIQQVLVNLAVNARDAMPNGGHLHIETANEAVGPEDTRAHPGALPGPYVLLAVADTGVGMNEEVRSHLFEPFFTTKGLGKGTGLGLATCHGIVRQMGGHILVYSEPGQGTTFRIYLPRKDGAADPLPAAAEPKPIPVGVETILVVEDEPHVRRLAVLGLRAQGYVVLEAADGGEAIEIAGRVGHTIDAIVSDVMMPGMSGPEVLQRLSGVAPRARAVLMSGHAESTVLSPETAAHYAFLPKPFTPERLARKVREALDEAKAPS